MQPSLGFFQNTGAAGWAFFKIRPGPFFKIRPGPFSKYGLGFFQNTGSAAQVLRDSFGSGPYFEKGPARILKKAQADPVFCKKPRPYFVKKSPGRILYKAQAVAVFCKKPRDDFTK